MESVGGKKIAIENEHWVVKLKRILPAGPMYEEDDDGEWVQTGYREHEIVNFIAKDGGNRFSYAKSLTIIG